MLSRVQTTPLSRSKKNKNKKTRDTFFWARAIFRLVKILDYTKANLCCCFIYLTQIYIGFGKMCLIYAGRKNIF